MKRDLYFVVRRWGTMEAKALFSLILEDGESLFNYRQGQICDTITKAEYDTWKNLKCLPVHHPASYYHVFDKDDKVARTGLEIIPAAPIPEDDPET